MRCYLSPKKTIPREEIDKQFGPSIMVDLSPDLFHTYGKCQQRLQLLKRMRFSTVDINNDHFQRVIEQSEDCRPNDSKQFSKYLDLISTEELNDKPLSRLQSRYPLRRISRVSLRPKPTDKVDIKTMDLSSNLRKVCLRGVESLKPSDVVSKINETEIYCTTTQSKETFGQNWPQIDCQTNNDSNNSEEPLLISDKLDFNSSDNPIAGQICCLVLPKLSVCPNCGDPLFNRSRKNTKRKRYHSCLKGIANNQLSQELAKAFSEDSSSSSSSDTTPVGHP